MHHRSPVVERFPRLTRRAALAVRGPLALAAAVIASTLAACAPAGGGGGAGGGAGPAEPPRPAATPAPQPVTAPSAPVAFSYAPGSYHFAVTTDASIELFADSGARSESRTTRTYLTYRIGSRSTGARVITGTVDSFTVTPPPVEGATGALIAAPVAFRGAIDGARRLVELRPAAAAPVASDCGTPTQALFAVVRETVIMPPPMLYVGQTWEDSTTSTVCRGDVPLTTRAAHRYKVAGAVRLAGTEALYVTRSSAIELSGTGAQRGLSFTVGGRGTATADLYLDPAAGRFLGGTSQSELELNVSVPGRAAQRLHQRARTRVESTGVGGREAGARTAPARRRP